MLIPNKHNGYTRDGVRRVFFDGGGGGGGGHTTSTGTTYTSPVPEWLQGEQKDIVARGMALGQQPYQPYTGERVSQFTPLQRTAFGAAERQQIAPQLGLASGLATLGGVESFRDPGMAGSFMNPFIEQAIAPQLQGLARQAQIEGTRQQGEATMRGAFGGSRDAIMRAEREKNLLSQQSDVLGRGLAQAFDVGQQQFNAEQARRLGAAQALGGLGQQQFGQEMEITGRQQQFGTQQQQQIQRILDQQFADFQAQRDFPYQQIGFMSDLIQGRGGSTRQMYSTPGASPLQTIAGLGTAAAGFGGLARAEGGSIPSSYAEGGITALLGDQQLAQTTQNQDQSPMMQLAAAEEAQQRAMLRSAAPAEMPEMSDMTEEELLAALQSAIQQGDETKARVIAELIEERKMPESGIAQVAPESVGEVPEGGIMGMYNGGAVAFQEGGRTPYTPRLTSGQRMLDDAIQSGLIALEDMPDALPVQLAREGTRQTVDALGNVVEAVADTKALPKSSGYLAQLERDEQAREARRAAARERELASSRVMTATPQAAAAPAAGIATLSPALITPSAARDAKLLQRQDPMSGGVAQVLAAQQAEQKGVTGAAGNVATPGGAGSGIMGDNQLMAMAKRFGIDPQAAADRQTALAEQQAAARERGQSEREAALEAFIKQRGVYGQEQEAEARQEIEGLAGKKLDSKNFALIQAGLAILSADPSRGAFAAIGEGAAKGLMGYKGDLDKLEEKRDKINGRIDRILELRRLESTADGKERMALKNERTKLEELSLQDHRQIASNLDKDKTALGTTLFNAHLRQREAALNRASRTTDSLALQRLNLQALTGRRILLRDQLKAAKEDGNEAEVTRLNAELSSVDAALAEKSGQAAPSANMSGWGKAIVE